MIRLISFLEKKKKLIEIEKLKTIKLLNEKS